jgi:hypothetical protein
MLGVIVYLIAAFVVASLLTLVYVMMRPVNARDELKSWRVMLFSYLFVIAAPYAYSEIMTRLVGDPMKHAVNEALDDAEVGGDLKYFKVILYNGSTARVIAVTEGTADWGGTDKPVVAMTLAKEGQSWKVDSYRIVSSFKSGEDGFTLPPFF